MERLALLLIFISFITTIGAQSITITGRVVDADTKEGLPFSNVYFAGTNTGTATDIDGYYEIRTPKTTPDSLVASAIGFKTVAKVITNDSLQTINFYLQSADFTLSEVVVFAGENPANEIVRNIVRRKAENRIESFQSFYYESYSKVELDMENIPPKLQKSKLMKPFSFVFENVDSTSDEKPFLPIYMNERLEDVYYVNEEQKRKRVPKAQRTSGVENQTIIEFIRKIHQEFSIYDNWIEVVEKPFISPFADGGLGYYEYYIIDSTMMNGKWSYQLKFKPKRKQENTFYGDFWVADSSFAIQRLNMRMSPDANINLVSRVIIFQEFDPLDTNWLPVTQKMVVDFRPDFDLPGMIGRRTETFKDFEINRREIANQYEIKDSDYLNEELKRENEFWEEARHVPLTKTEASVYAMIDSIQRVPVYKTYLQVAEMIFTGYVEVGPVEIGPLFSVYSSNPVEGHRFRLGMRTSPQFSKDVQLGGYLAYGLDDERYKYGLEGKWLLSRKPRVLLGAAYKKDISLNSENSEEFQEGDLLSGTLRRNIYQKLIDVNEGKVYYERYWNNVFSNRLTFLHRRLDPYGQVTPEGGGFNYAFLNDPDRTTDADTIINTTEVLFKTRYAFGERFIDGRFDRVSAGSKYPIVELQYGLGVNGLLGGDYSYHKLSLNYRHWFNIAPIGWFSYRFRAGKVWGKVPFLLMEVHPGNESYFMSRNAFNTMNRYEFASDAYASILLEHHFDGFIFNRIPLIRKLDFRAVTTFKALVGSISDKNKSANQLNAFQVQDIETYSGFQTPDRGPYMEAGVGIENILKFIRVDALWRLSYLDNPEASRFTVIFGMYFYF